ncbi:MAG: phosphopantothenate/pantothenate synthetase [Candidatus Thorarchaeota archaeon]|nr:MAG: phosphopantothenate/pantothenate synthetase [Candidatus Thorarchaeota archaeon]
MVEIEIPDNHPRKVSLETREKIIKGHTTQEVATAGLLAHGRGEAFDYLIGEETNDLAKQAISVAVAAMLAARHPVISVNGNVCALVPYEIVQLSKLTGAPLEINLFYYRKEREDAILGALISAGAKEILGTHDRPSETIPELKSNRRKVDPDGIGSADVVLVPLEDGDRTEALKAIGKYVITIDLNPMSRTAVFSDVTIVDNIVRCLPLMVECARELKDTPHDELLKIVENFDNEKNLADSMELIRSRLGKLSKDIRPLRQKKLSGANA